MAALDRAISTMVASDLRDRQKMARGGYVYIVANRRRGTIYVGVTSNLARRVWEHKAGVADGFTKKYRLKCLVWAEHHDDIYAAIQREKNLKHWPRAWKIHLIEVQNPGWRDLYSEML